MMIHTKKHELDGSINDERGQICSYYTINDHLIYDLPHGVNLLTCRLCGYTTHDEQICHKYGETYHLRSDTLRHLLMCHLGIHWQPDCECGQKHTWKIPDNYENPDGLELSPNGFKIDLNRAYAEEHFPKMVANRKLCNYD